MQVNQSLSILFYRKKKKMNKTTGLIPLYCRVTIDGIEDEMSTGCKVLYDDWDTDAKTVKPTCNDHKSINKKLRQMKTDIERHFDLVVAKNGCASPTQVLISYKTPPVVQQRQIEKKENLQLSSEVDAIIDEYVKHCRNHEMAFREGTPGPERIALLEDKRQLLLKEVKRVCEKAQKIFDDKSWVKTLMLAVDELLLHFLQLVTTEHRSRHTLEKMWGRKRRIFSFLQIRYKLSDIPLTELEHKFISDLVGFSLTHYENQENTAMKYALFLKEIIDRAVTIGWVQANIFSTFQCTYKKPKHQWPTMQQVVQLINWQFEDPKFTEIRDIQIFQCFNGLSYAEVYSLKAEDIPGITPMRQYELIELFISSINDWMVKIRKKVGIERSVTTYVARHTFSTVMKRSGASTEYIQEALGHTNIKTTENYLDSFEKEVKKEFATKLVSFKEQQLPESA